MSDRAALTPGRRPCLSRLLVGGLAIAALAVPGAGTVAAAAPPAPRSVETSAPTTDPVLSDITMVQANIYTGLTVPRFQADVATVLSLQPDFVTYNEVPFRSDAVMAPEGYSIYRDMRDRFTAATPVAWRSDRWTSIDQGVFRISDWRGKPPGRVVEIGRRFANWVTLQGVDGRTLSVVSIHVAPLDKNMPDLLRGSVERLGILTDQLSAVGPVLVGGDFNVHYKSGRYPRDLLDAHALAPTFDTLGNYFPTGDHQGATIDYVFAQGDEQLIADQHYPVELKSDHDAVVAGLSWTGDVPTDTVPADTVLVRSDPDGDNATRRAVLKNLKVGINAAPAGAKLRLVSTEVELFAVRARLLAAARRGVSVKASVVTKPLSEVELKLRRQLRETAQGSWVRRCKDECAQTWAASSHPRTLMMISDVSGAWAARYDANRDVTAAIIERSTELTVSTAPSALEAGVELLRSLS